MIGILGIALAIYLLSKTGKNGTTITQTDLPGTTGTPPAGGSSADWQGNFDVLVKESENWPWTWTRRPAIFQDTPLSPGSRERWLSMGRLWMDYKDIQTEIEAEKRDAAQTAQERGGGAIDISRDLKILNGRANAIMKRIKQIANTQRTFEARYKNFLVNEYGAAQVANFYEDRKQEIIAGIWPQNETQVVPVKKNEIQKVPAVNLDVRQVNTSATMGARDIERDAAREALPPGKRFTDAGTVYYEYRKNRSDYPGSI